MQRSRWAILWAIVLIVGGGLLLAQNLNLLSRFQISTWIFILVGLSALFLLDFLSAPGTDWWALIPGSVLLGAAAAIYLSERDVRSEWVGSLMLFAIGMPFLLIYLIKRGAFWWALIPGGLLTVLAVIPLLEMQISGAFIGALIMWAIALPFWVVYLANRRNWWAIIPGGVLVVIGLVPLLILSGAPQQFVSSIFFIGLAAVFGLVYLLHIRRPEMSWAIYPAGILLAIGIGVMAFGQNWWPVILIALGVILLIRAALPR